MHQFEVHILFSGKEWLNKKTRLQKEKEIIRSYLLKEIYNKHPLTVKEERENYRVVCEIDGKWYSSIAEASQLTGERETKIRNKLSNNFPGYVIIKKVRHGYEVIIANGKEYKSITEAVEAGEANNWFTVMRRLKNKNFKDWNYLSPDKFINKLES
jgi:hypothetical protein